MNKKGMNDSVSSCKFLLMTLTIFALIFMLAACKSSRPNTTRTHAESVKVTFEASKNINKNSKGEANPLRIMVYELSQTQVFMASDYMTLVGGEDPDFSAQSSLIYDTIILPGEKRQKIFNIPEKTVALGVINSYQNISGAEWKVLYVIPEKPKRSWYQRHFKKEETWQPHIKVGMNNLTTTVKLVN